METSLLRPDPVALGKEWERIVIEEYEQVEAVREWHNEDYYRPIAHHFADNPYREGDPILDRLRSLSRPDATWLDIGSGGGRFALPLALVSKHVHAVDPSAGMREVLTNSMREYDIENVSLHPYRWPEGSDTVQADFSLTAHVGYDIRPINEFIDGTERASHELCVSLMMDRAPSGGFVRLWEKVHGFKRQQLPAMREYVHLLLARGATPEIELYPRTGREYDEPTIREEARRRLWLVEGSEKDRRLQELITEEIAAGVDDYQQPTTVAMIRWKPVRNS